MSIKSTRSNKVIWIAWERHRRTENLCSYFNIESYILESSLSRFLKHPIFVILTTRKLLLVRPTILIVQNPSLVLTLLSCMLKPLFRYGLIVDSHNAAIFPDSKVMKKIKFLIKYINRISDLTIVTNKSLEKIVNENRGTAFILPDKIPEVGLIKKKQLAAEYNLVFICTFGIDEPFLEVFEMATKLPENTQVYVTGNVKNAPLGVYDKYKDIVVFTGFLPDNEYWSLLKTSDLIIDLTLREDCLVCGAYEAVSIGTPLLLSNTNALKKYFYKGAIFTDNNATSILHGIDEAIARIAPLECEISELKEEINVVWEKRATSFYRLISDLSA